jgi:hypothetical protein
LDTSAKDRANGDPWFRRQPWQKWDRFDRTDSRIGGLIWVEQRSFELDDPCRVILAPKCARRAWRPAASTERDTDEHPPRDVAEGADNGAGASVTGRARLPGGEQRKASQKRSRPAVLIAAVVAAPTFRPGDRVRWSRYAGTVQRVVDDLAEVVEETRAARWRLPMTQLTRVVG